MVRHRSSSRPTVPAKISTGRMILPNSIPSIKNRAMITKRDRILKRADIPYIPRMLIFMAQFRNKGTDWTGAVISPAPYR